MSDLKKYALLIDAENTNIKYLDNIFDELRSYGIITYKRMYGDFTKEELKEWNARALDYAIVPIQQPHYSKYKNAADIMLVIDAMDILYAGAVDGFCIVSNDSDFTRLVNRLCDGGMEVIGMGISQASKTLKAACTEYKNLEQIFSTDTDEVLESTDVQGAQLEEIKKTIKELILKDNGVSGLGGIKSSLQRTYSDFDERNFGYATMRKFVESLEGFIVVQEDTSIYVKINEQQYTEEEEVKAFIVEMVKKSRCDMGHLGNLVHNRFPDFDCRDYEYSQFAKFIASIPKIQAYRVGNKIMVKENTNYNQKKGKN
ncbi:MAG: NYN domain-containing protein [Lachnospiraceae bacterium]|nr:NYN domain-containing protein [Lachnospiraceae bacterium]